ncbi:sulfotransferase 1 family member D1-like [Amphiura filiformis]|uniref:sulfotransferase 1 family member D1-like n=1 Tax=Amphiura filiformis TaxID=82378 RepID=UPI003B2174CC
MASLIPPLKPPLLLIKDDNVVGLNCKPSNNLRSKLVHVKDKTPKDKQSNVVYGLTYSETSCAQSYVELQHLVESLPVVEWKKGENVFHEFEGYFFERATTTTTLELLKKWEVRKDDTFVLAYPKAGNTWMLQIISLILNNGDVNKANGTNISFRVPFLEMSPVKHYSQVSMVPSPPTVIDDLPSPRLIKTHLPYQVLPKQTWDIKPKVIYVARNPKDLAVSYYHFTEYNLGMPNFATFGDFLDEFCAARVYGGHYLEEAKFWWERRDEPNVLFVKYEDMKKVCKVGIFLI